MFVTFAKEHEIDQPVDVAVDVLQRESDHKRDADRDQRVGGVARFGEKLVEKKFHQYKDADDNDRNSGEDRRAVKYELNVEQPAAQNCIRHGRKRVSVK